VSDGPGFGLYVGGQRIGGVVDVHGPEISQYPFMPVGEDAYAIPTLASAGTVKIDMGAVDWPAALGLVAGADVRPLVIRAPVHPAWWVRLRNRLTRRDPGTYELIRGSARVTKVTSYVGSESVESVVEMQITSPIEAGVQPESRIETQWRRLCSLFRR
jgi:hypothetical protein